jgi:hypothetical protein
MSEKRKRDILIRIHSPLLFVQGDMKLDEDSPLASLKRERAANLINLPPRPLFGGEKVKKSTMGVILSGAKDLSLLFSGNAEMLRCAQHDKSEFFHAFRWEGGEGAKRAHGEF